MRFLFYDTISLLEKGNRIVGVKNAALNEDFLTGHFQKTAIFPGPLLIEAVAQVAGWLVNATMDFKVSALMSLVEGVRFVKDVRPGDKIILEAELLNLQDGASEASGNAKVDNEIVMTVNRILFYHYQSPDEQFIQDEKERFNYFSGGFRLNDNGREQ